MADPYATASDYIDRLGKPLTQPQEMQVTAYLVDASALIRSRLRKAGAPPGYEPDADMARAVTIAIVRRTMANPGGLRSKQMGGWMESYGEDGGLYVTDAELDSLMPDEDEGGAYTVRLADAAYGPGARHPHLHGHHHPLRGW